MPSSHVVVDQVDGAFDGDQAVASAGLPLPATLAERLGIKQATDQLLDLGGPARRGPPSRKLLTLVNALAARVRPTADFDAPTAPLRPPPRPRRGPWTHCPFPAVYLRIRTPSRFHLGASTAPWLPDPYA